MSKGLSRAPQATPMAPNGHFVSTKRLHFRKRASRLDERLTFQPQPAAGSASTAALGSGRVPGGRFVATKRLLLLKPSVSPRRNAHPRAFGGQGHHTDIEKSYLRIVLPSQLLARFWTKIALKRESGEGHTRFDRTGQYFEALRRPRGPQGIPQGTPRDPQGPPRDPQGSKHHISDSCSPLS